MRRSFFLAFVLVVGLFVAVPASPVSAESPESPARAALPSCHGANDYGGQWLPSQNHGWPDGVDCVMYQGFNNWGVVALQNALIVCYGFDIALDGQFGPNTEAALRTLQSWAGITADGIYGPETRGTIAWVTYSAGGSCQPAIV